MSRSGRRGAAALGLFALMLVVGAWWFRDDLGRLLDHQDEPVEVSPEAAAAAVTKLERLQTEGEPARLSSVEVSSVLRYRSPAWIADRLHEPAVEFASDTVRVSGTVATSDLPSHPELDRIRFVLPDSSRIEVSGRVLPLAPGRVALQVDGVSFAGVPIPDRYYPAVLERFGRRDEAGLPPEALAVSLPEGVEGAHVEAGYLVLTP